MKCRYCGNEVKSAAGRLVHKGSYYCQLSPDKKHLLVPEGNLCIYCGKTVKSVIGKLTVQGNYTCMYSPTKKHCLFN